MNRTFIIVGFVFVTLLLFYDASVASNSLHIKNRMYNSNGYTFDSSLVKLLIQPYGDSIVLRFAPKDYNAFVQSTQKGIHVQRSSDNINFKTIATVFPISKNKLDAESLKNDSIAILAASMLYGKNNSMAGMNLGEINRANNELHSMSLLLSEFSANAATILGFRFVDNNIELGKDYYYRASITGEEINSESVFINNKKNNSREPFEFRAVPDDGFVKLEWSKDYNARQFSYYKIERSTDNKSFYPITSKPLVMFETEVSSQAPIFDYTDSFNIINDQIYYYRLYGGTSFAEYSVPALSNAIPKDLTPPNPPNWKNIAYSDSTKFITLEWEFDLDNLSEDLNYYQIMSSRSEFGPFTPVSSKLGIEDIGFIHEFTGTWNEKNEGIHYFKIDCYDYNNNVSNSNINLVVVPDFTNPQPPQNFQGFVDSLGIVRLSWERSRSADVSGYWLYWSNSPDAEFSLVKQESITDTNYVYYIPEKSLNKYIYYTIRSEDTNYNRSEAYPILTVKRLDKMPPITPTINKIYADSSRIKLTCYPSTSDDVEVTEIYRRSVDQQDTLWYLIGKLPKEANFIDTSALFDIHYQYKIRAKDFSGNISEYSPIKSASRSIDKSIALVSGVKLAQKNKQKEVELIWSFVNTQVLPNDQYKYIIFKSSGNSGVKYYTSVSSSINKFIDNEVSAGVVYNYAIQIQTANNWKGGISEIKSILIQ